MNPSAGAGGAFSGTRASYVALSAITVLALALLSSIWTSDISGTVALLGLLSIYLASQEMLVLYMLFLPASVVVDVIRLSGVPHSSSGRGWLIFLQLLEMAAKAAGAVFAWSLYKSVASGEALSSYSAPPPPPPGPSQAVSSYERVHDPFSSYAAPRAPLHGSGIPAMAPPPAVAPQQQVQQQQVQQQPAHDLV